jgi:hypothetical protein
MPRTDPEPPAAAAVPPVPIVDTEAFRRKLAGLEDPSPREGPTPANRGHLKDVASRLCVVLADLYDVSDADRTALWEHIAKALAVADERTAGDDMERFVSEALSVVKADPARAAANDGLSGLLHEMAGWPPATRAEFLAHLRTRPYAVLTFGRARWEEHKAANRAGKGANNGS